MKEFYKVVRSYAFLILSKAHFAELYPVFKGQKFKTIEHSLKIIYENKFQKNSIINSPHQNGDIGLFSKRCGKHPAGLFLLFGAIEDVHNNDTYSAAQFASIVDLNSCK